MKATKEELRKKCVEDFDRLTDINNHTQALLVIAKYFKLRSTIDALKSIGDLHKYFVHMPGGVMELRTQIRKDIKKYALSENEIEIANLL